MRSVIYGGANSLDNYIARLDDGMDWLMWNDEVTDIMAAYWKRIDTIIIGRKSWEVTQKMAEGGDTGHEDENITTYLCSRTMTTAPKGMELANDAVKLVRELKSGDGKDIMIMGGGELGRSLLEADLVDEIGVNIHPVLLGSGVPLFHPVARQ